MTSVEIWGVSPKHPDTIGLFLAYFGEVLWSSVSGYMDEDMSLKILMTYSVAFYFFICDYIL